jgi:glucose/arabinose dehydrogenase
VTDFDPRRARPDLWLRARTPLAAAVAGLLSLAAVLPALAAAPSVTLVPVDDGFTKPVLATNAGDGSDRLFVVEKAGVIKIVEGGSTLPTPFLDIADKVGTDGERGMLSLAFHPSYETNRKFYVFYTRVSTGRLVIAEYKASTGDPDVADETTARTILTIAHPATNHNGGHLAFGRDGYLYISTGDGGGSGDPANNAQSKDSLLGKILRIDINRTSGSRAYARPASNPYVGKPGLNEIWSRGLRNPWRFSFDRLNGDLWIGDVGQQKWEEIDRSTKTNGAGKGKNFGWRVMEGFHCYRPSSGCNRDGKSMPLAEYSHSYGCSVTGGHVYRGTQSPTMRGYYVFGDFCSGRIWTLPRTADRPAAETQVLDTDLMISSFGEDEGGEVYVVDYAGGAVYRLSAP